MAKPPARPAAAKHSPATRAAQRRAAKHDPAVIAPLPLYSVFLLGTFAMRPGPSRGGK